MCIRDRLDAIARPFGWLLMRLYEFFGNYGIAIIVFAIIVRLLLLPFMACLLYTSTHFHIRCGKNLLVSGVNVCRDVFNCLRKFRRFFYVVLDAADGREHRGMVSSFIYIADIFQGEIGHQPD